MAPAPVNHRTFIIPHAQHTTAAPRQAHTSLISLVANGSPLRIEILPMGCALPASGVVLKTTLHPPSAHPQPPQPQ
jgi:hypothetical protein